MRRLFAGLGNPGERYRRTRHNLGFEVIRELARRRRIAIGRMECNALVGGDDRALLVMPQTYMNRSGYALRCLVERHGFSAPDALVIYDDVNLPLGRLRMRRGGGPGGHRGMESVIHSLRTDEIARLRLGVAAGIDQASEEDLAEFVLEPFEDGELETVQEMIRRAADACEAWEEEGIEAAMNRFNG